MRDEAGTGKRSLGAELGLSRRDLLRRGAVVGGTLLWVAPAIQSITPNAYAQQQVGSFRACCQCNGADGSSVGCAADVITYDECLQSCSGKDQTATYGVGNYSCVDGSCVSVDEEAPEEVPAEVTGHAG